MHEQIINNKIYWLWIQNIYNSVVNIVESKFKSASTRNRIFKKVLFTLLFIWYQCIIHRIMQWFEVKIIELWTTEFKQSFFKNNMVGEENYKFYCYIALANCSSFTSSSFYERLISKIGLKSSCFAFNVNDLKHFG